ncbi:Hypothetical protein, predicted transmembrane protein [Mycoplasma yeatsii 13926]|uniref:Transmembrane protein n=1 Tax=Mycoplasma yeatsii 13926 TaxID=1188240 RepID=S6G8P0_9MOLU|nr:hypothetical protein [Mycoplasma yeatsii]EOA07569.1 Hypothetical protein, predicted transmembrane protein [Mycoplasma yeatsii 13926]
MISNNISSSLISSIVLYVLILCLSIFIFISSFYLLFQIKVRLKLIKKENLLFLYNHKNYLIVLFNSLFDFVLLIIVSVIFSLYINQNISNKYYVFEICVIIKIINVILLYFLNPKLIKTILVINTTKYLIFSNTLIGLEKIFSIRFENKTFKKVVINYFDQNNNKEQIKLYINKKLEIWIKDNLNKYIKD